MTQDELWMQKYLDGQQQYTSKVAEIYRLCTERFENGYQICKDVFLKQIFPNLSHLEIIAGLR